MGWFFCWYKWKWWKHSEKRLKSVMLGLDQDWFCLVSMKKRRKSGGCVIFSLFFKRKAGARGRFVLRSLLLLSMDFTIIYKGWKKGMRCLSRFMTLNSNGKDPIVGQKWTSQATKARLHKLIKLLSLERCCDTYKDDHPTRIKMGWSTMSNHEKWLVCFVWWRNKALNIFKKQSFRQLFK